VPNFTEKLIADVETQAAEIAELKQAIAALTDKLNPPKPAPVSPPGFGGAPVIDAQDRGRDIEDHAAYMERIQRQAIAHQELEKSYMAKRKEGLTDGQWRDDCGIIRDREGKVVPSGRALEQQLAKAAAHDKAARDEDLAWRKSVELPIRHGADDDDLNGGDDE
jgi:hypothetical protein